VKTTLVACATLVIALALGACSGDDEPTSAPSPAAGSSSAPPATEGVISPADLPAEPAFDNRAQGVISDVTVESCDTEPGDVTARGTAKNSGKFPRDVAVVMSWTVGSVGDVVARGVAEVEDLEPGESAEWTIETTLPGSTTAACVPSAQAGQLKD
jgi:ABC-type glycerol-3-phosphate transport system substrate-binding protein